jgi:hypothetical protein
MKKARTILLVLALVIGCGWLLLQQRAHTAQRGLAEILPKIAAITLYDVQDSTADSDVLATSLSTPFPVEAFRRVCALATSECGFAVWKGSSLAVLEFSDGTHCQARFSYYQGFFTIEGLSGYFVAPGSAALEFQRIHDKLIQEQFIPRRHEQSKSRTA